MKNVLLLLLLAGLTCPPSVARAQQPIPNPGFELGTDPWLFYTDGTGSFTSDAPGFGSARAGHVLLTAAGTNVQLYQHSVPLQPAHRYRLRFQARSSTGGDLSVFLHKHTSPYTDYGAGRHRFDLTPSWRTIEFEFVTSGFTSPVADARLRFSFPPDAAPGEEYRLDNVELLPVGPEPAAPVTWAATYGGPWAEDVQEVRETADGGYIVAASTWSYGAAYYDAWILKLRAEGSIEWQKRYGGDRWDMANGVCQTPDGGYIVAGWTESFGAGSKDAWILKLAPDGIPEWQTTCGGPAAEELRSVAPAPDGGCIATGWTESFGAGGRDAFVLRVAGDGTVTSRLTYGGSGRDELTCIERTADNGFVLAGSTESFGIGSPAAWVVRLTQSGAVNWQNAYSGRYWDRAHSAVQTADGGFIVSGHTFSFGAGSTDLWLLKLNPDGSMAWQRSYGGSEWDGGTLVQQTGDGGFVLAGGAISFGDGNGDGWVMKLDSAGTCGHCPPARPTAATAGTGGALVRPTSAAPQAAGATSMPTAVPAIPTSAEPLGICPAASNLVLNPGFESGRSPWRFFTDGDGTFANDVPGPSSARAAHVTAAAPGTNTQLYQKELVLQPATRYRLSFRARSSRGQDMSVHLQRHVPPYSSYGLGSWVVDLTPTWQEFTRVLQTGGFSSTVADARLRFSFSAFAAPGDEYFMDDVELVWLGIGREAASPETAEAADLAQNYPNPFNPSTTITYTVPPGERHAVSLRVYDLIGREVAVLVDEVRQAGTHTVTWDARGVAAGVYFCRLVAGDLVWTKRMILLK